MTDTDELADWFPGVDRGRLEAIVDELDEPTEWNVARVLNHLADLGEVAPGNYEQLLERQLVDGWSPAACADCGKTFTGETPEAAQRKVNGHQSSHRVQGSSEDATAADGDTGAPTSIREAERSLEDRTDREAGEYPSPEEAMAELREGAEAEVEDLEADGGEG